MKRSKLELIRSLAELLTKEAKLLDEESCDSESDESKAASKFRSWAKSIIEECGELNSPEEHASAGTWAETLGSIHRLVDELGVGNDNDSERRVLERAIYKLAIEIYES